MNAQRNFRSGVLPLLVAFLLRSVAAQRCSVCGIDSAVGSPSAVIVDPISKLNTTCGDLETQGLDGSFNVLQCTIVQLYVDNVGVCDCQSASTDSPTAKPVRAPTKAPVPSPTKAPVAAPTKTPVASPTATPVASPTGAPTDVPATPSPTSSPTLSPTDAPVVPTLVPTPAANTTAPVPTPAPTIVVVSNTTAPTSPGTGAPTGFTRAPGGAPSPGPTAARFPVSGSVFVVLNSVAGSMDAEQTQWFQSQTSVFLVGALGGTTNVGTSLKNQTLGVAGSNGLSPLTANLDVTAIQFNLTRRLRRLEDFSTEVAAAINGDPQGYIEILKQGNTKPVRDYFANLTTVASSTEPIAPTPAPAPAPAGLSAGAKAGISVAVIVFAAVLGGAIYYAECYKKSAQERARGPTSPVRTSSSASSQRLSGTASPTTVVATTTAAAIPKSSYKREDDESDFPLASDVESTPSLAITGGDSAVGTEDEAGSYAYSLDAGNVTTATGTGGGGDAASTLTGAASVASTGTFSATRKFKRTVEAPAGRLGIVIDTTLEGPVVHTIKPDSPLRNILHVGDIIVMINDVDTKAMSATSITSLMVRTADQERTLTVLSNR